MRTTMDKHEDSTFLIDGVSVKYHDDQLHTHDRELQISHDMLNRNDHIAAHLRAFFLQKDIYAINLMGAPGCGKTTLLEKSLLQTGNVPVFVIGGDQNTSKDAERIRSTAHKVVQVNTGKVHHLTAEMIHMALHKLKPHVGSIVIMENVGNLICPALYDLGETKRVVMWSVTEGDDKPLKYPDAFASAQLCIINKVDLLPYVDFNLKVARHTLHSINPDLRIMEMSAIKGYNLSEWIGWLVDHHPISI